MSPLAKVKQQDALDFREAALKRHDDSVHVAQYSWDFFMFFFLTFCKASILVALFSCFSKLLSDVTSISIVGGS